MYLEWQNRIWAASLDLNFIFWFFETFCEHAPRNKLSGSTNLTYESKVKGVWKFYEKFGQGGHVM
jgi:hypothetical protein